jgi:hypothetical protein
MVEQSGLTGWLMLMFFLKSFHKQKLKIRYQSRSVFEDSQEWVEVHSLHKSWQKSRAQFENIKEWFLLPSSHCKNSFDWRLTLFSEIPVHHIFIFAILFIFTLLWNDCYVNLFNEASTFTLNHISTKKVIL